MQAVMVRWFCRFYMLMLYGYPREFRMQFGREMQMLFHDRCLQVMRTPGRWRWVRFAIHSSGDWLRTIFAERLQNMRQITVQDCARQVAGTAQAVWKAGRKNQRGFVSDWTMTAVIFLFATTSLVQAYVVPTGSMESSLMVGDHMLVDRLSYSTPGALGSHMLPYRDIHRGDIVAFRYPEDIRETYVKRVIGIPGDRIHLENKQVVRNGQHLIEPYTQHIDPSFQPYRDNFPASPQYDTTPRGRDMLENHVEGGELVVPAGKLFVLGDNRENSADSRYWGFVPRENVVGKALVVYWSYDAPTADLETWNLGHFVDVMAHFFTKTRWERTFLVLRSQQAEVAR